MLIDEIERSARVVSRQKVLGIRRKEPLDRLDLVDGAPEGATPSRQSVVVQSRDAIQESRRDPVDGGPP